MRSNGFRRGILINLAILLLLALSGCSIFKPAFKGEVVEPAAAAPGINLPDQNGDAFELSGRQGKVVLLFFGFTNCVDECPLAMAHMKLAQEMLGESAGDVQVVLVSTDPVRDTPAAMQAFLGKFDPSFIGIPGGTEQLAKVWNDYGVVVLDGGETHSSLIYAIDKAGKLRLRLDGGISPEDMASDLKILLAE